MKCVEKWNPGPCLGARFGEERLPELEHPQLPIARSRRISVIVLAFTLYDSVSEV